MADARVDDAIETEGAEMDPKKQQALIDAGFRFGSAEDFLELTDEERRLVEAKLQALRSGKSSTDIAPPLAAHSESIRILALP